MVAVEWSLALMGWMMAVHGVKVQVRRLFSREAGGRCEGPQRRARVGRFAAAQKGERIVVRGAATWTSASRMGRAVEEGSMAIGAREGEMRRQRDWIGLDWIGLQNNRRRMERKGKQRRVQEKVAVSWEKMAHTHAHTQLLHLAKAVQAGLCSA